MIINVFCPLCNKTSSFQHDESETTQREEKKSLVPTPNIRDKSNGLVQLSLAHDDHILLLDVDNNGDVRSLKTVSRVGSEKQIAGYIALLTNLITNIGDKNGIGLYIYTNSTKWDLIINYITSQIMLNNIKNPDPTPDVGFEMNYEGNSFQFSTKNFKLVKNGEINPNYPTIVQIFDVEKPDSINTIHENLMLDNATNQMRFGIALTSQTVLSEVQKEITPIIAEITSKKLNVTISDCSSLDKRLMYLINLVNE